MKQVPSNQTDVLAMMNKLQERLFIMDQKLNTLINRSNPGGAPAAKPQEKPHNHGHNHSHAHPKQIYSAVCADCQKECTIPFKPSGDRPVYCQECYALRRSGQAPKPPDVIRAEDPVSVKPRKKAAVKKAAPKKKTTAKKK